MDRSVHLYARDGHGRALSHSSFTLSAADGTPLGEVVDSDGEGSFQVDGPRTQLRAQAHHGGVSLPPAVLGADVDDWVFKFDVVQELTVMDLAKANIPVIVGLLLLAVALALAFTFSDPTPLQSQLIRSTAALGLGGVASILPGMLRAKLTLGKQLAVSATGAAAVYVISYFVVPA